MNEEILNQIKKMTDFYIEYGINLHHEDNQAETNIVNQLYKLLEQENNKREQPIPNDAHSLEVFAIKDSTESPTGKQAFIGFKRYNGNFEFIGVPFTEPTDANKIISCESCAFLSPEYDDHCKNCYQHKKFKNK